MQGAVAGKEKQRGGSRTPKITNAEHPERSSRYRGACRSVLSAHQKILWFVLNKLLSQKKSYVAAPVLGPRAGRHLRGWRRIQARRLTCTLLLRAVQRRRVESLVLGALSPSPVHTVRSCVGVGDQHRAVLLGCSKSSRQCDVYYLRYLKSCTYFAGRGSAVTFPGGLGRPRRAPATGSHTGGPRPITHQRTESTVEVRKNFLHTKQAKVIYRMRELCGVRETAIV